VNGIKLPHIEFPRVRDGVIADLQMVPADRQLHPLPDWPEALYP
jgi:hypothetical protein